jgi:hypothetical protein
MVSVLASGEVDSGLELQSGKNKDISNFFNHQIFNEFRGKHTYHYTTDAIILLYKCDDNTNSDFNSSTF